MVTLNIPMSNGGLPSEHVSCVDYMIVRKLWFKKSIKRETGKSLTKFIDKIHVKRLKLTEDVLISGSEKHRVIVY